MSKKTRVALGVTQLALSIVINSVVSESAQNVVEVQDFVHTFKVLFLYYI